MRIVKRRNQTDYRFKVLYTLGMFFIVSGHCNGGGISLFNNWFPPYAFHLGLFMFASGYFYKREEERAPLKYLWNKVKKLIVPLYLWNFVYAAIIEISRVFGFTIGEDVSFKNLFLMPIMDGDQFEYNLCGWFIIPLFMVQVFNILIQLSFSKIKIKNRSLKDAIVFLCYLLMGILGVYLASIGYHRDWWLVLDRMLYFLPFFGLGILYRSTLEVWDRIPNVLYFGGIFVIELFIMLLYGRAPAYTPSWCNDFTDGPILPFVVGFLGIAFWLRVAGLIEPVVGHSKWVNLISSNTYSIMINQFLAFMVIKCGYAFVNFYTGYFSGFDWEAFRSNLWYYYTPRGLETFNILYLLAGIAIPIAIQLLLNKIKSKFKQICSTIKAG